MNAIDLFCGGGGLTVGLKRAGFTVHSAVEIDSTALATYKVNHPSVKVFRQDIRTLEGTDLVSGLPEQNVELIAGCPPCQGFSSLTAKYHRDDPRNELVLEMLRIIRELKPVSVMMENVPGLSRTEIFKYFLSQLEDIGYIASYDVLQVADYGIPQSRRRLVLLAGLGFKIQIPKPTHSRNGKGDLLPWKTLKDTIWDSPSPITLSESRKQGGPQNFNWHIVRDISEQNRLRLEHSSPGESRNKLPVHLRPKCHQNVEDGFSNVYGRMTWDQPSVTVTAGCTTLSKGRFGHPEELRTISVREAAKLQTFPDDYIFDTEFMDKACSIVGNALPCNFAEIMSKACLDSIKVMYSNSNNILQDSTS